MFRFENTNYDDPGSYQRRKVVEAPLRLDELPEAAREGLANVRLPVRFATTEALHLADSMGSADVATYGDVPLRYTPKKEMEEEQPVRHPPVSRPKRRPWMVYALVLAAMLVVLIVALRAAL